MLYLHSLSLILITLQTSLFYRQVIGESEKLGNFLKVWNGQNQDENPSLLGLLFSSYTLWPPKASLPIDFLETAWGLQFTAVLQGHERNSHILSSCTEDWNCRGHRTWLWAEEGSTSGGLEHIPLFLSGPTRDTLGCSMRKRAHLPCYFRITII